MRNTFLSGFFIGIFLTLYAIAAGYLQVHNDIASCGPVNQSNDGESK